MTEDFATIRSIVLSAFETSENLANECVKRGERIKELESVIDGNNLRIADLESMRDTVRKTRDIREDDLFERINELGAELKHNQQNIKLLDDILEIVNTVVRRNTEFSHILHTTYNAEQMRDVCGAVVKFRKEHNIKR